MKADIRIATKEYCYIEFQVEGTMEEIFEEHRKALQMNMNQTGIADRDYNGFIDRQLSGEANHVETYQAMSDLQKFAVQVIKRALNRAEARESKLPKITE